MLVLSGSGVTLRDGGTEWRLLQEVGKGDCVARRGLYLAVGVRAVGSPWHDWADRFPPVLPQILLALLGVRLVPLKTTKQMSEKANTHNLSEKTNQAPECLSVLCV